jgi:hypothetical protein
MDPTQNKFLYGLVSGLDVFAIWSLILTGIGYASVTLPEPMTFAIGAGGAYSSTGIRSTRGKTVKRSTAIAMVAGLFVLYKLAAVALGSLG